MKKLHTIIFIDDDIATNDYHRFISLKADLAENVMFFLTAESALKYLKKITSRYEFPELIFIDINMPSMDGHEFISEVHELSFYNSERTKLSYLTTTMTNKDVSEYAANGMKYFYFKPLSAVRLCKAVSEIFGIDTSEKSIPTFNVKGRRL